MKYYLQRALNVLLRKPRRIEMPSVGTMTKSNKEKSNDVAEIIAAL